MITIFWIYIIFLETGIYVVRATIPVQCAMSSNTVNEAGNWPDTVGTYHNDLKWTELGYYRLRCEFLNGNPRDDSVVFKVYHDHWKRPFEKEDCERAGCTPVMWNSNSPFLSGHPIIDVYWSNVVQFATTATQLKICETNATNPTVTFTTSQLNDMTMCQLSGRFRRFGTNDNSSILVKDFFMHVSSDMFSEQEIEQVNNGENVLITVDKDCSAGYRFRDGCDVVILASPFSYCRASILIHQYHTRPHRGLEVTEISDNRNRLIAYKYRMTTYKFYSTTYSNLNKGKFVFNNRHFIRKPVEFELNCWDNGLYKMLSRSYRTHISRRFTVRTLYYGVRKYMERWEHFYLPSDHEVVINATILSLNNVTRFQVNRDDGMNLKGGEVVVKPAVYDRHNHITTYSITFPNPSISHAAYTIDYNIDSIDVRLFRSFVITRPREIEMAINPMKIVVVRGDRSAAPFFTCVATGFPVGVTITWSKEFGTMKADQVPVSSELLPSHVQGAYLRFPSATDLTTDYNGEYTCTVTSNRLPTRKLSAIFVVLEPGSYYGLFYNQWVPINPGPGDVVVTQEERSLFSCINRPVIVQSGGLPCTQPSGKKGTFAEIMIAISVTVLALAAVLSITISIYRWYWKHNQVPVDPSSTQASLLDVTSSSNATTTDSEADIKEGTD